MARIQLRRGTTEAWDAANPVLASGEAGYDLDTGVLKIGDGESLWDELDGISGGGGGGAVDSVNGETGTVVLTAADVGADPAGSASSAQAAAIQRANHTGTQAIATVTGLQAALDAKQATSEKGQANGYAALDSGGKVPSAQLPSIVLTDVDVVADIPARDALTPQEGDVAIVQDAGSGAAATYIYDGTTWQLIDTVTSGVASVTAAAPITSSGGTDPEIGISAATTGAAGSMSAADKTKLDGVETGADVTDAANVAAAGAVMEADTTTAAMGFVVDEDDMTSNSATKVPTQQSVKAYVDASAGSALTSNTQTGNYTLVLSDAGKVIEMNVAGANTVTVPPNSDVAFPVGTVIGLYQMGAGTTTVQAGVGVTIRNVGALAGQYAEGTLRKRATDEWVLSA